MTTKRSALSTTARSSRDQGAAVLKEVADGRHEAKPGSEPKDKLPPAPFSSATVEVTPEVGAFAEITFHLKEPFREDNKAKRGSYDLTHVIQFGGVVVSSSGKHMEVLGRLTRGPGCPRVFEGVWRLKIQVSRERRYALRTVSLRRVAGEVVGLASDVAAAGPVPAELELYSHVDGKTMTTHIEGRLKF